MGYMDVGYAKPGQVTDVSQEQRLAGLFVRVGIHLFRTEEYVMQGGKHTKSGIAEYQNLTISV